MGQLQSLAKLPSGFKTNEVEVDGTIRSTILRCYREKFEEPSKNVEVDQFKVAVLYPVEVDKFKEAVLYTVGEINKKLEATQFCLPKAEKLEEIFQNFYEKEEELKGKPMKKETFMRILQEVIITSGLTNFGIRDIFLYIFGIPAASWFIKKRVGVAEKAVSDEVFIPGATIASVLLLSKLNKI